MRGIEVRRSHRPGLSRVGACPLFGFRLVIVSTKVDDGSFRRPADPCVRISFQAPDDRQSITNVMSDHHSRRHLPNTPCIVRQSLQDGRHRLVVPGPKQPSRGPHAQPICRASGLVKAGCPPSGTPTQCKEQFGICISTCQQRDATSYESALPQALALCVDAFARRRPPFRRCWHMTSMSARTWARRRAQAEALTRREILRRPGSLQR